MTSISVVAGALAGVQQQAQAYLAQRPLPPRTAASNPYGTITQSYQSEGVLTDESEYSYDLGKIDASTRADNGENQSLLAVGQALKAAASVDPGTGISEINAGALAGLAKSIESAFSSLLNESAATWQTNTGGLSKSDIDAAVMQAVQQFASGQGGGAFSLSLSTVKDSVIDQSRSSTGVPGLNASYAAQGVSLISRQSTLSISLSADGKLSSSYHGTELQVEQGIVTEDGVKGADAAPNPSRWLGTYYSVSEPIITLPQAGAAPAGAMASNSRTLAFVQSSHTIIQSATDQGQTGPEVIDEAQQGGAVASRGRNEKGAFFSQTSVLETVTAVAQAFRDAARGSVTAKLSVTSTLAMSLTNSKGQPVFFYTRPDGTLGRFGSGGLNTLA